MQSLVCAVQNYDWGKTGTESTVRCLTSTGCTQLVAPPLSLPASEFVLFCD